MKKFKLILALVVLGIGVFLLQSHAIPFWQGLL